MKVDRKRQFWCDEGTGSVRVGVLAVPRHLSHSTFKGPERHGRGGDDREGTRPVASRGAQGHASRGPEYFKDAVEDSHQASSRRDVAAMCRHPR